VYLTTAEMTALNSRIQSNLASIYAIVDHILVDVYAELREHILALHAAASSVRSLDILQSMATVWATAVDPDTLTMPHWLDPDSHEASASAAPDATLGGTLPAAAAAAATRSAASSSSGSGDEGQPGRAARAGMRLQLVGARHPVLDQAFRVPVVPNTVELGGSCAPLAILTGPNGSGKSTLLTTVAQIVVMAHVGSPVPCSLARMQPVRSLFTRMGFDDELATNASSFVVEMREAASILSRADSDSLVLIDELGRSTSALDGASIAWAVLEELLSLQSLTLFVTHMHELNCLAHTYPDQAKTLVMQVHCEQARAPDHGASADPSSAAISSRTVKIRPLFSVSADATSATSGYGIVAAASVGLPRIITQAAWAIHASMTSSRASRESAQILAQTAAGKAASLIEAAKAQSLATGAITAQIQRQAAALLAALEGTGTSPPPVSASASTRRALLLDDVPVSLPTAMPAPVPGLGPVRDCPVSALEPKPDHKRRFSSPVAVAHQLEAAPSASSASEPCSIAEPKRVRMAEPCCGPAATPPVKAHQPRGSAGCSSALIEPPNAGAASVPSWMQALL
jgi:nucleoside-triphosphatase THEP1